MSLRNVLSATCNMRRALRYADSYVLCNIIFTASSVDTIIDAVPGERLPSWCCISCCDAALLAERFGTYEQLRQPSSEVVEHFRAVVGLQAAVAHARTHAGRHIVHIG